MPHGEYRADQHLDDLHRHEGLQEHGRQRVQSAAPGRAPQGRGAARHGGKQHDARVDGQRPHDGPRAPIQHAHGRGHTAFGLRRGFAALLRHPMVDARIDAHGDHAQQDEGNDGGDGGQRQGQQSLARRAAVHPQAASRGQRAHIVHALPHVGGHAGQETLHAIGHAFLQAGLGRLGRLGRRERRGGLGPGLLCAQRVHQGLADFGIVQQVGQRGRAQRRGCSRRLLRLQRERCHGRGLPDKRQATQHRRQQQGRQPGSLPPAPPETGGMIAEQDGNGCCRC
ncbi:hypothetical protein D3C71_1313470 [compost metagenome]